MLKVEPKTLWELLGNTTRLAATRGLAAAGSFSGTREASPEKAIQGSHPNALAGLVPHEKDSLCKTLDLKQIHK